MFKQRLVPLLCGSLLLTGCIGTEPMAQAVIAEPVQAVSADINCDGETDQIRLLYPEGENQVKVEVTLGGDQGVSALRFGLSDSTRQNALCGAVADLEVVRGDADALAQILGEVPRGYQTGEQCSDLVLRGGECDSINLYWDHSRRHLNWWRL